jgi:hypothetical protein
MACFLVDLNSGHTRNAHTILAEKQCGKSDMAYWDCLTHDCDKLPWGLTKNKQLHVSAFNEAIIRLYKIYKKAQCTTKQDDQGSVSSRTVQHTSCFCNKFVFYSTESCWFWCNQHNETSHSKVCPTCQASSSQQVCKFPSNLNPLFTCTCSHQPTIAKTVLVYSNKDNNIFSVYLGIIQVLCCSKKFCAPFPVDARDLLTRT